jgi:hypothetical protein
VGIKTIKESFQREKSKSRENGPVHLNVDMENFEQEEKTITVLLQED